MKGKIKICVKIQNNKYTELTEKKDDNHNKIILKGIKNTKRIKKKCRKNGLNRKLKF